MRELSEQVVRKSRRITAKRRRRRNQIIFIIIIFALVFGSVGGLFIFKYQSDENQKLMQFQGIWKYDEYTQYEFDGRGSGCMCLEDLHYEYVYAVNDNELRIDFKDDSVRDCTYTFLIKDDTMMITGGEGTVGGSYELYKEK